MKMPKARRRSYNCPPGDYPFEVITAEELPDKNGKPFLRVRIKGTDPKEPELALTWESSLGGWRETQANGFLEAIGVPYDSDFEAHDLIGLTGLAYWERGAPSESPKWEGTEFLEPTDAPGAPGGFYPKEGSEQIRDDDYYTPPEEENE